MAASGCARSERGALEECFPCELLLLPGRAINTQMWKQTVARGNAENDARAHRTAHAHGPTRDRTPMTLRFAGPGER